MKDSLSAAVLAGGHSSRFGSNKALFKPESASGLCPSGLVSLLHGRSFLEHAIDTLRPLTDEVLISTSKANKSDYELAGYDSAVQPAIDAATQPAAAAAVQPTSTVQPAAEADSSCSVQLVTDIFDDCGPLGGIHALLSRSTRPWLLVLTCDMPYVTTDTLRRMLSIPRDGVDAITAGQFPLLLRRSTLPVLTSCLKAGDYRVRSFLNRLRLQSFILTDTESRNINKL